MKPTILYCLAASIILFIVAFYFNDEIFDFFLSFFKDGHLIISQQGVGSPFVVVLKVCLSVGIIPLIILIVWIAGKISSFSKRIFSILVVIVCIAITIMLNVFRIKSHEMVMTNLPAHVYFPLEELFFEYAIAVGAISGAVISYLAFRKRKIMKN